MFQWRGTEVRLLPYSEFAQTSGCEVYHNSGQLVEGNIAIFILHQSDDDAKEGCVVLVRLPLKDEPTYIAECEDSAAYSALAFAGLVCWFLKVRGN